MQQRIKLVVSTRFKSIFVAAELSNKEGPLHPRLLARKISVLHPAFSAPALFRRKTAYISLLRSAFRIQRFSLGPVQQNNIDKLETKTTTTTKQTRAARFINQNYKDRTSACVTNMPRDFGLQSLRIRRKQQRLTFCFKTVRELTPAVHAN